MMAVFGSGLVTVFGGSGFIGAQAVRALAKKGWRIRVAVRNPVTANELQPLGDVGQIQLVRCDVTRPEDVALALKGADAAVNLVGALYEAPGRSFRKLHVDAAETIAKAARAAKIDRVVQVSSIGADTQGAAAYARSKGEAEVLMRRIRPDAVILRPSIVFGMGDGFLNRFAAMATWSPVLPLIGGGETRFQPVYVGDVAEAVAQAVIRPEVGGQTFELGGPAIYSFKDLLRLILRETGRNRLLVPMPFFIARILGSAAQTTALVGVAPLLTRDQVLMLETDNVVAQGAEDIAALGVQPTGLEAIVPSYLWRYRVGGQFAERPAI
jgi:NADH dehydrogenase